MGKEGFHLNSNHSSNTLLILDDSRLGVDSSLSRVRSRWFGSEKSREEEQEERRREMGKVVLDECW